MSGEHLLIQFGISLIASLLAGLVVYFATEPRLKGTIKTIQDELSAPLNNLVPIVKGIQDAIDKLVKKNVGK